jgi:AraC-like DNA-binding protein
MRLKGLDKRSITVDENKLLHDIFNADIQSSFGKLVLYNRVLLLIEKMIRRFLLTKLPVSKTQRLKEKDMDGLKEVEFALSEKDLEKFPSVKELSRIALMSTTKLKKRFKEVYGMKLYEFYNYNRLSKARQSIESGESTIKDAAYQSGYSNLSNFSKAFKKEFGLSPSHVKPD